MTDDEHIAELQRQAYGAHTPDAARARAVAELAELAATAERNAGAPMRDATGHDPAEGRDLAGEPRTDPAAADPADHDGARSRARRWAVISGVAGLLVGVAVGTLIGRETPVGSDVATVDLAPTAPAFGSGEPGTPLDDTALPQLFDRLAPAVDDGELGLAPSGMDPASLRLIATRTDGPAAYIARTADGTDVCLILVVAPDGWVEYRCTSGGRLQAGGLRIRIAHPVAGFAVAILNSGGTLTLGLDAGR